MNERRKKKCTAQRRSNECNFVSAHANYKTKTRFNAEPLKW